MRLVTDMRQCPGCKIILPIKENIPYEGNLARYGVTSPECLALFNELLLKEYEYNRPILARFDAYGVQHPPYKEIQEKLKVSSRYIAASKQSVAIHLIALYLMLEKKLPLSDIPIIMNRILSSGIALENEVLITPKQLGDLNIAAVTKACNKEEHIQLAWLWNQSAWNAWQIYHDKVAQWYEKYGK